MDMSNIVAALQLAGYLAGLALLAAAGGGFIAGILRVATQIDDQAISFVGRFAGVALLFYFASSSYSSQILEFTARIWGGADLYH
jgi:flagellar biosynthesis protein FliQ